MALGVSLRDLEIMTLDEAAATFKAAQQLRESDLQADWERTRMLAAIVIQPHCRKKIKPQQLLPLPWDKPKNKRKIESREEAKKHFDEAIKRIKAHEDSKI